MNETFRKELHTQYQKAAGVPDASQLAAINRFALKELTDQEVYVRTAYLAHNAIDRDREVFDDALLDAFAASLPGKGLFVKHPGGWDGDSGPGVGRWFSARVVSMGFEEARAVLREPKMQWPASATVAKLLETSWYVPRSAKNADLISDVDAGVASDVSIGFRATDRTAIQDVSGNTIAMRILGPGEALEGSLVWLGAQPGARVHKSATKTDLSKEDTMSTVDQQLKDANTRAETAESNVLKFKSKADAFDKIEAAVGEELAKSPEALALAAQDGQEFRKSLVDELIRLDRLGGDLGDDDKAVDNARKEYSTYPMARLKTFIARHEKATKGGEQLKGGATSVPKAGESAATVKSDAPGALPSFLKNPAITNQV